MKNAPEIDPEGLHSLSDDDLNSLAGDLQESAQALREQAASDDTVLGQLEDLAASYQLVQDELAEREVQKEARGERVQQALSRIGAPAVDGAPETEGGEVAEPDAMDGAEAPEMVAASVDDTATTTGDAAPAAAATTDEETLSEEAGTIPQDPATARVPSDPNAPEGMSNQEAAVGGDEVHQPVGTEHDAVAQLSANRPASGVPAVATETQERKAHRGGVRRGERSKLSTFVDNGLVSPDGKGDEIDRGKLAALICKKHGQLARMSSSVSYEPITLASARVDEHEFELGSGHEENFSIIEAATQRGAALVAAGGNCAPLAPNWDVFNVAEAMSPIENFLPSMGAPRGGIRYVQPPSWPEAQEGVRFTTTAEDADGYTNQPDYGGEGIPGTTAPKPCVRMECLPIVECEVDAVSQCVTFGNLQYRTFPEQVEVFLSHLATAFAQAKEISYLDAIEAGSTAVNASPPYGATRGAVFAWTLAAHAYRKRNRMPLDAPLDVLAPDSMIPLLKADMINDLHLGLSFLDVDEGAVARELFDRLNLNVEFYYDFSTDYGSTAAMLQAQVAGPLNAFPSIYRSYMYAPGTWVRLDGGTLDVGIVRDSTLNSQNDLQIFAEEFTQVCKIGIESIRLDLTLCPSGAGPAPVTALICNS
ncbi:MAG TPA: major capsid protein [Acidimicrobiia bacterium]|nr:major capsid protein [Acidimicrobiia bacterium]